MERLLTHCTLGSTNVFKWAQSRDKHWEERILRTGEKPAKELNDEYKRLAYVVQYICGFRGDAEHVVERIEILGINIEHAETLGERMRFVTIKARIYSPQIGAHIKVATPKLSEIFTTTYIDGKTVTQILDGLEKAAMGYIDGYRAQTQLQFEKAEEMAEAAKDDVG